MSNTLKPETLKFIEKESIRRYVAYIPIQEHFTEGAKFALTDTAILNSEGLSRNEWISVEYIPKFPEGVKTIDCLFKYNSERYGELYSLGYFRKDKDEEAYAYVSGNDISNCHSYLVLRNITPPNQ